MSPDETGPAPEPGPAASDQLRRAVRVMHAVRDRCVWTQQMTHRSLVPYVLEESAELVDAIEQGTRDDMREELGDLLWQVLFHAEIASRETDAPFDIDDVARGLADKMVRRHPHVFGDAVARTPEEVRDLWNAAKAREKSARVSVLDGVSERMPTLALAQKILGRAQEVAPVPEDDVEGEALAVPTSEAELGDVLLGLAALARRRGWNAERALRTRLRTLQADVRAAEAGPPRDTDPEAPPGTV